MKNYRVLGPTEIVQEGDQYYEKATRAWKKVWKNDIGLEAQNIPFLPSPRVRRPLPGASLKAWLRGEEAILGDADVISGADSLIDCLEFDEEYENLVFYDNENEGSGRWVIDVLGDGTAVTYERSWD